MAIKGALEVQKVGTSAGTPAKARSLGAKYDAGKTRIDFKVFSKNATRRQLEVFAESMGKPAVLTIPLSRGADGTFSGQIPTAELKRRGITGPVYYGYRAWGPNFTYDPK